MVQQRTTPPPASHHPSGPNVIQTVTSPERLVLEVVDRVGEVSRYWRLMSTFWSG